MNPYKVLDINPSATKEEIRLAYRRKAKEFHPDLNKSRNAEIRFKRVVRSYEMLMDNNYNPLTEDDSISNPPSRPEPTEEEKAAKKEAKKAYREEQERYKQKHMENVRKAQEKAKIKGIIDDIMIYVVIFGFILAVSSILDYFF